MTEEDEEFARIERESAMRQEPARTTMLADQPAQKRPQNCGTGYCSCIECVMEPAQQAVPDAIHHTDLGETFEYIQGWNDCRQLMMEMIRKEIKCLKKQ